MPQSDATTAGALLPLPALPVPLALAQTVTWPAARSK